MPDGSDEQQSLEQGAAPEAQPPVRICQRCSTQASTDGSHCPYCGASYLRRRRPSRRLVLVSAALVLLIAGGVTAAVLAKQHHDQQVRQEKREAALEKARAAAKRRAQAREATRRAAEAADRVQRDYRSQLERSMRRSITKDARQAVDDGLLNGPILSTSCDTIAGGADALSAKRGRYECLAVNKRNDDGTASGYRYTSRIDYEKGSWSWRLGG
jgi:DNA-directed RNA polymerase subunit RPC12/RpoP